MGFLVLVYDLLSGIPLWDLGARTTSEVYDLVPNESDISNCIKEQVNPNSYYNKALEARLIQSLSPLNLSR